MRSKVAVVLFVLLAVHVTGQEEPLPSVFTRPEPSVILAVEPARETTAPSLAEAARANDYVTFHALYLASKDTRYATLDELWTYSVTDPIGAFYGAAMHDRLAAAYPGFAKYIADYAITDANGAVFYPTSETRAFLLAHLGEASPKLAPKTAPAVRERKAKGAEARVTPAPRRHRRVVRTASVPPVAPIAVVVRNYEPPKAAPVVRAIPAAPVVVAAEPQVVAPVAVRDSNAVASRGILLLVIGLIGIGVLAVIVRTPREEPEKPAGTVDNVEPIRRPAAPDETPRATGSHG